MSAATQVYYASFDAVFLKLPPALRARVEAKIDEIGSQLGSFQHHRLKGIMATEPPRFLCCCAPPYAHEDTYFD